MKIFLLIFWGTMSMSAQNVSPQFSELKGFVDYSGSTHLLYRIFSSQGNSFYNSSSNSIYDLDVTTKTDSIYLWDEYWCNQFMGSGINIYDYEFWNGDSKKYIICGDHVNCFEPHLFISRFDTSDVLEGMFLSLNKIDISKQNDSIVLVGPDMLKSIDGGISWDTLSLEFSFLSLSPFDDNVFFADGPYQINKNALYKSTDGGKTFNIADTEEYWRTEFFYDVDEHHVYRYSSTGYFNVSLKASYNQGNAFTWSTIYDSDQHFYVCLDPSHSGYIYLADRKKIFRSTDYGNSFSLYQEIEHRIIGIYKKPNSNKLYAATKYRIYELTGDTISIIKSLPIPDEILAYYPVAIGSTWIYDYTWFETPVTSTSDIFVRKIINEVIKPNGKNYFEIREKYVAMGLENTVYERVDTIEGKVYRYEESCPDSEQIIDDLLMEAGDSSLITRFHDCIGYPPTEFLSESPFSKWGIYSAERKYISNNLLTVNYSLVRDIGLYSYSLADDNGEKVFQLKGMLKNGIVYGDTSRIVGVNDKYSLQPVEFMLSQNYPNPFNPSTKISWQSPVSSWQTLKVYDVLGNEVETLVNEYKPAGSYEVEFSAKGGFASGLYFYTLKVGNYFASKKMIFLK